MCISRVVKEWTFVSLVPLKNCVTYSESDWLFKVQFCKLSVWFGVVPIALSSLSVKWGRICLRPKAILGNHKGKPYDIACSSQQGLGPWMCVWGPAPQWARLPLLMKTCFCPTGSPRNTRDGVHLWEIIFTYTIAKMPFSCSAFCAQSKYWYTQLLQ